MSMTPAAEVLAPEDCLHKDWTLGCERCFFEATNLAKGNLKVAPNDDQLIQAQVEGAVLFNWHVLMVIKDVQLQLAPLCQQMDISRSEQAKQVLRQMRSLEAYLVTVVQDPKVLNRVLVESAHLAMEMQKHMKEEAEGTAPPPRPLITLTD